MDASGLFGGGPPAATPGSGSGSGPIVSSDEPPRSAASLFGGEPEDDPSRLRVGTAAEIQDMPDDLFGGGGGSGGFGSSPARPGPATFGGAPPAPPPPPVGGVPEGLFGGSGSTDEAPSDFGFGGEFGGSSTGGFAGVQASRPDSRGGAPPPSSSYPPQNDLFGAPPPPADGSGSGGFRGPPVGAFPSSQKTPETFDAPPSELFGGPPPSSSPPGQPFGASGPPPPPSDASRRRSRHNSSPWDSPHERSAAPPASSPERSVEPFGADSSSSRAWSHIARVPTPPGSVDLGSPPATESGSSAPRSFGVQPSAADGLGSPPSSMFGAPPDDVFGAPPPPPQSAGGGRSSPSAHGHGSPPSAMFGAPPPGAFGAPPPAGSELGSPPSSAFGAPPEGAFGAPPPWSGSEAGETPSAASKAQVGSPPPTMFGAPPEEAFGAQPPPSSSGVDGRSPPVVAAASSGSPPGRMFGGATFGAPPRDAFAAPPPPPAPSSAGMSRGTPSTAVPALRSGSPPSTMSGARPPGGCGAPAPPPPTAELGSPPSSMFGAPPAQDAFGAPPPSSSAGGRSPPTSGQLGSPPAALFDAPPQEASHAPHAPPTAAELGSPPASMFDAPPQGSGPTATPFAPPSGTGGALGEDTFGAKSDLFGGGVGEPAGAAPFGSPPGGMFGGDDGEDQSSAWWESETGNVDQPESRAESEKLASGTATGENKSDAASAVSASAGFGGTRPESPEATFGTQEEVPSMLEPRQGTSPSACAEDLGAPPADLFGPPPPAAAHAEAKSTAEPQTEAETPFGRTPRPEAPPSRVTDDSAVPAPFSSQPPYGVKVDVGDVEGVGSTAAVGADRSGSGLEADAEAEAEAWTDQTASPGWEKQASPPLDLGVFGAPPADSVAAVGGASDLFGAASGAAGESGEDEGGYSGWGMCSADPEGTPQSDAAKGTADTDTDTAKAAPPASTASTGYMGGSLQKFAHSSNPPRSSFVANDGTAAASVAALALEIAPSSPPRLFAERSASWTEKDTTPTGEKMDYGGMFAGKERKPSGDGLPPVEECPEQQGRDDTNETVNLATGGPTSSLAMGEVPALLPRSEPARHSSPGLNLSPPGGNTDSSSERYSQGAQPPFSTIPEALDSQSPPRLRGRPRDEHRPDEEGPAVEVTATTSHARDGSTGPAAATPESGGRVGAASTLSTPFGALSRGSGTTPRIAEGFPSSEDGDGGGDVDGPPAQGFVSEGKDAPGSAESSGGSPGLEATAASVADPSLSTEGGVDGVDGGDAAVEEANDGEAARVESNPQVVEGKEDGQPRWDVPQAAAGSPPPSAAGEAARKMDSDSAPTVDGGDGDGWSDDDWGVDDDDDNADAVGEVRDPGGNRAGKEETEGAAVATGDGHPGAVERGGESEQNLFGSEASDGDDSWGGGQEDDGGGPAEEEEDEDEGEESCSESESDLDSFSDNDLSNEASIAETTASDFFATPTSPESDLGSPRPRPRSASTSTSRREGRASVGSVSPLSGYNSSGSRRKRRETSGGSGTSSFRGGGGGGSSSVLSLISPFSLADVPPIFPLSVAPRPRRPSGAGAGSPGLPPPVPVAHTYSAPSGSTGAAERSGRSTWRSVSPSRAGEDRGWSISPVLAARASANRNAVSPVIMGKAGTDAGGVAYASPSARTSLGAGGERRDGGEARAPLPPPHGAPKREAGRPAGAADVAKLGRAMGMLSTEAPKEPVRPFGAETAGVCETKRDDPPEPPAGETVPKSSEGGDADHTRSSVAALNQSPSAGVPSREAPVEEAQPSCESGPTSAPTESPQTHPPPPTSSTPDQGWMTGLPEAAPPTAGEQGPASFSNLPNAGEVNDGVFRDDNDPRDISAAFGSDGGSASNSPRLPPASASNTPGEPPAVAWAAAVPEALSLGVAAGPSPFVNTSSPLTRSRNKAGQEASMFGPADDAVNGKTEAGAADLFATEAPARAADELFSSEPGAAADAAGSFGGSSGDGGGGGNDTSVFSQAPPPETLAVPSPSLPNPWGSSPLKQPLPEPKRWPTKGGTGFDRPLTPLAATGKVSGAGPPQAGGARAEAGAGAIPSAFFGPASGDSGDDNNAGFGDVGAGGGGGLEGQAFDKPPVAGPLPGMSPAKKPWESGGSGNTRRPSGGAPGEAAPTANSSASPASSKLSSSRFGAAGGYKGFSGRGEASGGAWGGSSALAAAAEMAAATVGTAAVGTDRAAREQGVTPAGVIASFGFGGKLVTMHPRRKIKLAPAPGVPSAPDDGSTLRKGPINVWSLKDVAGPEAVVRDAESFPGPASSAPIEKVKEYVEKRAAGGEEGDRLLWSVAGLALQFKGCLTSDAGAVDPKSPEAAIVKLLKAAHGRRKEAIAAAAAPDKGAATSGAAAAKASPFGGKDPSLSYPGTGGGAQGHLFRPGQRTGTGTGGFTAGAAAQQQPLAPGATGAGVGPFGGVSVPGRFGGGNSGLGGHGTVAVPAAASAATAATAAGSGFGEAGGARAGAGDEGQGEGSREEVEALLVDGKKEEAVDASIRAGLWGLALLIAAQCPVPAPATPPPAGRERGDAAPPQPPYQRVVRLYANAFLHTGTPLHTMALAFSGQAGAAIKHGGKSLGGGAGGALAVGASGGGGGGAEAAPSGGFEDSWMVTAALIVSNKVPGWAEQLVGLGDRLLESGNVPAAHAMFLVAGIQVELPTTKGARLILPGVDHKKAAHRALRTAEATDAVHVLEVLEIASRSGGRVQNSAVQGHKLRLAMRLSDLGFLQKAYEYVRSAQAEVAAMGGRSQGGSEQRSPYSPQFITALNEFEDRTCAALGMEAASADSKPGAAGGGKKGSGAGSAAAGAGGWVLNRLTNLVKTSATPGPAPAPSRSRSSSAASLHQGQNPDQHQDHATTSLHGAPPAASGGPPGAWPARQPMPGPRPGQTAAPGVSRDSFLPPPRMAGSPPPPPTGGAKWSGAPSSQDMQQRPFGPGSAPRPPGVEANKSSPISGAGGAAAGGWGQQGPIQGQPQSTAVPGGGAQHFTQGAGGAFGSPPPRSATASPAFGESDAATVDPTRSPAQNGAGNGSPNNATGVPGAGAAVVAKRLVNRGPPDGGVTTPGKGVPHVSSAPVLSGKGHGGSDGRDSSGNDGGGVASGAAADAGGGGAGKGGKVVEQAPKSEPRKGAKGKNMPRRASAGPAAVAAKPGRLAKMMSKWLYPEAKHADVGNEMEAYYDEKTKRWVFPGEPQAEASTGPPPAPPTASQLGPSAGGGGPPGSLGGGGIASPPNSTPGLDANDPLAALMAPPPVSVGAPRRQSSPPLGGGPPPMGGLGGASFNAAGAKKFTAFVPKTPVSAFGGGAGAGAGGGGGGGTDSAAGSPHQG